MAKQSSNRPVRDIPIKDIDRSRNYRISEPDDAERLAEMIESIKAAGQLQDVRVYERGPDQKNDKHKEPFILGFGDRRCRALLALGKTTVRAVVLPPASDTEIEQARAIENLHRKDVSPLGEAQAVANLLDAIKRDKTFSGDPYEEAATRLAQSVTWIKDRDYLHRLTQPVRAFASQVGLPAGHLRELAKLGDPDDQFRLACEAAGAQPWLFTPSKDSENTAAKAARERFLQTLADGGIQRWPISRLKQQVELLKRSLKIVPWQYQESIEHDGVTLRPCAACPHNSETDRTLFGLEAESDNPRGYCLNASCFEAKREASETAKAAVYRKIAGRKDQTPMAIKRATPGWLKESAVIGFVQRQLKKVASGNGTEEPKPAKRRASSVRELSAHEQAILKFTEACEAWLKKAFNAVLKGINADPVHRVGWCLLAGTEAFQRQQNWQIPRVNVHSEEPCTEAPALEPLPDIVKQAITLAMKGTRSAWVELAGWNKQGDPDYREQIGLIHPEALIHLADLLSVKLPKMPVWTPAPDSMPETVQPSESKKSE